MSHTVSPAAYQTSSRDSVTTESQCRNPWQSTNMEEKEKSKERCSWCELCSIICKLIVHDVSASVCLTYLFVRQKLPFLNQSYMLQLSACIALPKNCNSNNPHYWLFYVRNMSHRKTDRSHRARSLLEAKLEQVIPKWGPLPPVLCSDLTSVRGFWTRRFHLDWGIWSERLNLAAD